MIELKPIDLTTLENFIQPGKTELDYYINYNLLINSCLHRGLDKNKFPENCLEIHHIYPRCLGGKDVNENYVLLTVLEHIIAHTLLSMCPPNNITNCLNNKLGRKTARGFKWFRLRDAKLIWPEEIKLLEEQFYGNCRI